MTKLYWTQAQEDWRLWDEFLQENPRGIYLQTQAWLESYRAYGFSPELLLAKDSDGIILGGLGLVLAGMGPLKILVAPYGPIINEGHDNLAEEIIAEFKTKAKAKGAFMAQLSLPAAYSKDQAESQHLLSYKLTEALFSKVKKGLIFKYVAGIIGFRAVHLFPGEADAYEKVRANYKAATRRDVNKSGRMGNELYLPSSEAEIKEAYELIELNAVNQGYSVRTWNDFGPTLISLINKKQCFIACCKNEESLKGALIIFDVGKKLHYIMGATLREKKDLMVGHYLQDQVIQMAVQKGYDFYDISIGGSEGVVRFKEGFGGELIKITEPRYWVLKPLQFAIFQKLLPWAKKNKSKVAKLLSKFK
ncbi:lipid II:glycine glycyltransferase FemX [Algoriphagus chordae]|uniref:lipid II:glycine glycyltransferase FemX n=1 Tax=Algoriphagus chordae TaxID=237019 RepID=UPI001314BFCD|nr:peptidoglycan bridge formation glycyltransferase FemA/FemB family protein [Algoriphagus chordae]